MKRFLGALAGAVGLAALLRRRRRGAAGEVDPAAELRAKLAESKSLVDEQEADDAAEIRIDEAVPAPPEHRRAEVHERARQAMDELGS